MSSSNSPCAACKLQRRKCTQDCVFAPYFPPDQPQKFSNIHKVFGASNVAKLLNDLDASQREDAVNSLAYEAEFRLRDPVYGCVGLISLLQHRLKQVQRDLNNAKRELATYIGSNALGPFFQHAVYVPQPNHPSSSSVMPYGNLQTMMTVPSAQFLIRDQQLQHQQQLHPHQQQQLLDSHQQLMIGEQELIRGYEQQQEHHPQQQQHQELLRFDIGGFEPGGSVTATGFHQINPEQALSPSLALGAYQNPYHQIQPSPQLEQSHPHRQQMHQLMPQLLLDQQPQAPPQPQTPQLQPRAKSEEDRSVGL